MEITLGKGMVFIGVCHHPKKEAVHGLVFSPRNNAFPIGTLDPKGPFYKSKKDIIIWVENMDALDILDLNMSELKLTMKNYLVISKEFRDYLKKFEPERKS